MDLADQEGFPQIKSSCVLHHSQPKRWRLRVTPLNHQRSSAFAAAHIFRFWSCKSPGAFIMTPLPPILSEESQTAGPLGSAGITPPHSYFGPIRLPLAFGPFPGVPGYTAYLAPPISRRDEEGLSSCLARPCHHAVDNHPVGVIHRISLVAMNHVAFAITVDGSASEAESFEATSRSLALRPGDSPPSFRWRCR